MHNYWLYYSLAQTNGEHWASNCFVATLRTNNDTILSVEEVLAAWTSERYCGLIAESVKLSWSAFYFDVIGLQICRFSVRNAMRAVIDVSPHCCGHLRYIPLATRQRPYPCETTIHDLFRRQTNFPHNFNDVCMIGCDCNECLRLDASRKQYDKFKPGF